MSGIVNLAADERPEDRYPECRNAVILYEALFKEMRSYHSFCVFHARRNGLNHLVRIMREQVLKGNDEPGADPDRVAMSIAAKPEMDSPQFRTYLAAKLGLV